MESIAELARRVMPLSHAAMAAARTHLDTLAKPPGSLGRLEELAVRLAGRFLQNRRETKSARSVDNSNNAL